MATEGVTNEFPEGIVFTVSATVSSDILKVTLRYEILPDGVPAYGVPEFNPGPQVQVEFHFNTNDGQVYLAPGAEIRYHWEIEDAAANTLSTEPTTFVYQDTRFDWRVASEGNVSVHWYGNPDAQSYLQVARDTLDRMSALLGTQVDFPVKVWVYDDNEDMFEALPARQDQWTREHTGGVRVSSDTVLVLADGGGDILRHELTHVVTKVAGEDPYGGLPAWLDEGTAMYGQSEPGAGFTSALEGAINSDSLLPVRSMATLSAGNLEGTFLYYGQAWSIVKFLVETYGPERFAQLFAAFNEGSATDAALHEVYGFDQDGLEDAWRASLGLLPVD